MHARGGHLEPEPAPRPIVDRLLARYAPRMALRRAEARAALTELDRHLQKHHVRGYEAASKGRRTQGWRAEGTDANAEISEALDALRSRHRQLVRDNSWAGRAVRVLTNHTIGTGIVVRSVAKSGARRRRLDTLWKEFNRSKDVDQGGRLNLDSQIKLAFRSMVEGGDCLVRRVWTNDGPAGIPFRLQLLEGDHIATEVSRRNGDGSYVLQGVEYSAKGRPVAYHLYEQHPGAPWPLGSERKIHRVDARDILHPFRTDRIGQGRGVPWGAAAMLLLRDWDLYKDAQLLRQRIAACFVAFEHDISGDPDSPTLKTLPGYQKGGASDGADTQHIEPGTWEKLTGGRTITFGVPPGVDGYREQYQITAMDVAVAYDLTYQQLTGDLSQANYSSMRSGHIEQRSAIEGARWDIAIPHLCDPIHGWFVEGALVAGLIEPAGDLRQIDFTPPRVELLDPTVEIPAAIKEVRAGFTSWSEKLRGWGLDPELVAAEIAEDSKLFDTLFIALDSDGRRPQQGGAPNPPELANVAPAESAEAAARAHHILDRLRAG